MTRDELVEICRKAPTFAKGAIKHEDFIDWIVVLERKNSQTGEILETPYMPVPGKLAMALADHNSQGKQFSVGPTEIVSTTDKHVVLRVNCVSELYGSRSGMAVSRFGARGAEGDNPYEVAETSALGRALAGYGYGLLPKSGLSAGDIGSPETAGSHQAPRPRMTSQQVAEPRTLPTFWAACMRSYHLRPRDALQLLGITLDKPESLDDWVKQQQTSYQELYRKLATLAKPKESVA